MTSAPDLPWYAIQKVCNIGIQVLQLRDTWDTAEWRSDKGRSVFTIGMFVYTRGGRNLWARSSTSLLLLSLFVSHLFFYIVLFFASLLICVTPFFPFFYPPVPSFLLRSFLPFRFPPSFVPLPFPPSTLPCQRRRGPPGLTTHTLSLSQGVDLSPMFIDDPQ